MIIQTNRLYVRPFSEKDLDDFYLLNGDEEVMRYIRQPKSREESAIFLKRVIDDYQEYPGLGRWAIIEKLSEQCVGTFSLLPIENTRDTHIGYALLKKYWGKGYATEILKAGLKYAYDELKLPTIVAITHPGNLVSQKILRANHFTYEGLLKPTGEPEFLFRHNIADSLQNSG